MPAFAWDLVKEGGPWAILLLACAGFLWARARGILATEKDLERTVGGYVKVIEHQDREMAYLRGALDKKDSAIEKLSEQNAKLMAGADLSTYALESILREAGKRRELGT